MFFLSRINIFVVIIAFIINCGLILFVYYSLVRFLHIQKKIYKRLVFCLLLFLGFSFLLDSLLPHDFDNVLTQGLSFLFAAWVGIFSLLILSISILWFLRWIYQTGKFRFSFFPVSCFFFILPFLIIGYGVWQSFSLVITEVSIPLKNLPLYWQNKSIVHIADLHLSDINQIDFLENVVEKIQDISPEIVVITGDLFDGRNSGKQDLLSPFKQLSVPILFATGNHDRYFSSGQDFKDLGIDYVTLLHNELFEKEGLQIIGLGYSRRSDNEDPAEILKNEILFDGNKPTILLYHTPTTIEAAKKGDRYISPNTDFSFVKSLSIDLQLSGHTHGGQFFPATLITHFIYKGYEKGLHRDGNFSLFVSTGLGTWGPPVRIFAPPEIAVIHLGETF